MILKFAIQTVFISIHALRGEGDLLCKSLIGKLDYFNPRPPWGGRLTGRRGTLFSRLFQSTPSVGRATFTLIKNPKTLEISIHALRGEGDPARGYCGSECKLFQSTPSVGRATRLVAFS